MKLSIVERARECVGNAQIVLKNLEQYSKKAVVAAHTIITIAGSAGNRLSELALLLSVAESTLFRRVNSFHQNFRRNFELQNKPGPKSILTSSEKREIAEFVDSCCPLEISIPTAYWTSDLIVQIIAFFFGKKVRHSTVRRLLKEQGLSYHRGEIRNIKRDEVRIEKWKNESAPVLIENDIKSGNTVIFIDQSTFQSETIRQDTWGLKGKRITIPQGNKEKTNCIGGISLGGEVQFLTTISTIDSCVVIAFIEQLRCRFGNKISLYLDNASIHKSEAIKNYRLKHPDVKFHFLPPYAPELNPIELVWAWVKNHKMTRPILNSFVEVDEYVGDKLRDLTSQPEKILRLFNAPELSYIPKCK